MVCSTGNAHTSKAQRVATCGDVGTIFGICLGANLESGSRTHNHSRILSMRALELHD